MIKWSHLGAALTPKTNTGQNIDSLLKWEVGIRQVIYHLWLFNFVKAQTGGNALFDTVCVCEPDKCVV